MLDGGEVGWCMIGSDPTFVVAEEHVQNPVQAVLDRPVVAHHRSDEMRQQHQGGDVKACLLLDFIPTALTIDRCPLSITD